MRIGEGDQAVTRTASDRSGRGRFEENGINLWEIGGAGLFIDLSSMAAADVDAKK